MQCLKLKLMFRKLHGYLRAAAAVPTCQVADIEYNISQIEILWKEAHINGVDIVVFPELCITTSSCGDLFLQQSLQSTALRALETLANKSKKFQGCMAVVGTPIMHNGRIYNCAASIVDGEIKAITPKRNLNFHDGEQRFFSSGEFLTPDSTICISDCKIPFGCDILLNLQIGEYQAPVCIEIGEDLSAPIPLSTKMALHGALIELHPAADSELASGNQYLTDLIRIHSAQIHGACIHASAGWGESSTDVVHAGFSLIAESGKILSRGTRFSTKSQLQIADIDIQLLTTEHTLFYKFSSDNTAETSVRNIIIGQGNNTKTENLFRSISKSPFIPESVKLHNRCQEIIDIQTSGLMRRLHFTHCHNLVLGVSGGLDSTLALLIACEAFHRLELPTEGITAITMPGFGTSDRTYNNALQMMQLLGVRQKEISIRNAVTQHFKDIEHNIDVHNVTYENSQARERTQILMDYANEVGGMVLGTGDLSELALGWCTYNGDQMSMYGVNASVPKTLVQHLVRWFAEKSTNSKLGKILTDVVNTPISPELTPADEQGNIKQKTEDIVGPYELHDFYLYYILRYGFSPTKIFMLACKAFAHEYKPEVILKWLRNCYHRFFSQQFKRSCMPDGPKVGSIGLSPRGDWNMPSDASAAVWLKEIDKIKID